MFRSWFDPWVGQRHQLQQLDRGASSASRGVPGVAAWVQDGGRAGLPAHTIRRVLVAPLVPGGQPHMHVLPPSKQPFLDRILGAAAAAPAGLERAELYDHLVLDGEPLTPRRYQDRQRQFAVLLPDPKVAQGAPSPRRPDSPHCQLAEPGVILAEGFSRPLIGFLSLFYLTLQPLGVLPFVLFANSLLDLRLTGKNLLDLCSLLSERFFETVAWRRC